MGFRQFAGGSTGPGNILLCFDQQKNSSTKQKQLTLHLGYVNNALTSNGA